MTFLLLSATQEWTQGVAAPVQEVGFKPWKLEQIPVTVALISKECSCLVFALQCVTQCI